MDPRSQKPRDFVALFQNLTEDVKKSRLAQMKWMQKYEPLFEEYEKLQEELNELSKEKKIKIEVDVIAEDKRTCLPMPITSNSEYGWLATKPEFCLEKYGRYFVKYPDPFKDIILLEGNIPNLGIGKGFW